MADDLQNTTDGALADQASKYTVVARRYRPRTFEELVGQDTVAQGLLRAIETHRVGHAYLFTGARGVGKTSTARIFAKALNASADGKGHFDPKSEIALAIDSGDDMDVIEIDGASNRGIDEIRQLRSNASIRPTRSPYKIYIIDEVHMLTPQAFNALLKTLEEPPGHVKFIFCTTDPDKIPITVLSRCQRYDFPPVHTDQILTRLKFICTNEGTQADEDALKLIARRAAGSMRDSQSLLEQMLSFGGKHITVDEVHAMLGTADESRLALFAECMVRRDAARAITELNSAIADGVDPGQLAEQFLGYLRDVMTVAIGAPAELVRTADPSNVSDLKAYGNAWGLSTLLSAIQLLDESIVKMKHSVQSRILLEVALVQICTLADLQSIADIAQGIAQNLNPSAGPKRAELPSVQAPSVQAPSVQAPTEKKNVEQAPAAIAPVAIAPVPIAPVATEPAESTESSDVKKKELQNLSPSQETSELAEPRQQLALVALGLEGLARQLASLALDVVEHPEGRWKVRLAKEAEWTFSKFTSPENLRKLTEGLMRLTGRQIELDFVVTDEPMPQQQGVHDQGPKPTQGVSQPQRIREMMATDLIKRFIEVLGGEVVKVED
ncbi:MAG: DNA polymerase III subunit gamma/tau [Planctomycetota bacterium]|nr:DNA polymerase III subunit gamma/tau [Planctomycetota bacterium]